MKRVMTWRTPGRNKGPGFAIRPLLETHDVTLV
jgi:hypothetical protein